MLLESTLPVPFVVSSILLKKPPCGDIEQGATSGGYDIVEICVAAREKVPMIFVEQSEHHAEYERSQKRTFRPARSEILIVERSLGKPTKNRVKKSLSEFVDTCRNPDMRKNETDI